MTWWCNEMKTFSALLALPAENPPITGGFPLQRPLTGALMFSLICAWTTGWAYNRDPDDFRRHLAHYVVTVTMKYTTPIIRVCRSCLFVLLFCMVDLHVVVVHRCNADMRYVQIPVTRPCQITLSMSWRHQGCFQIDEIFMIWQATSSFFKHYNGVIMSALASQITSLKIVYSTVCSGADKKNIKAPRHWPLWEEFTGDRLIPRTKGQ